MSWPSLSSRTKTWGNEVLTSSDLHGQLDLLHTYINDFLNNTTGHDHTGGTSEGPLIDLTLAVKNTLPLNNGGTGQTTLSGLLGLIYPLGHIYISVSATNPGTLLGFGTWVSFGAGKFLLSVDSTDVDFDTVEETGGAKTVTIAQTNLPSYNLSATVYNANGSGSTGIQGTTNGATASTATIAAGGSGTALSVMNPYICAYMWKRTA